MKFFVSFPQMRVSDVSVNLRCGNISVTEHLLNTANIGSVLNQMRCKTMPQSVRRNIVKPAFFLRIL